MYWIGICYQQEEACLDISTRYASYRYVHDFRSSRAIPKFGFVNIV
jgi:hypothetical protein